MNKDKDIFDRIMEWKILSIFNPFYKKYKEVLLYLFFGGLTTIISIGSYAFFDVSMHMNPMIVNIFSWILAVLFAYVTNRIWVFDSNAEGMKGIIQEMVSFFGGRVATLLMEEAILYVGINLLSMNSIGVKVAAQILVLIGNYLISKLFVFRQTNMKTKRIQYIDLANVISTFAVVILHTNGCFWNFSRERYWLTANVIESLFIFAVPVFFMISSITLMDYQKKYDIKIYLKKRFSKTVIPFLFWTFMGLLFDTFFLHTVKVSDLTLKVLVDGFINNRFVQVYWFFMPLFGIYLSIPLFASIEEGKRIELFKYLFVVGFIFNATIPFLLSAFHLDITWPLNINVVIGYAIFVVMGYLIHKMDFTPNQRCIIYFLGLAGLLMHFGGTYYESYALGDVSQIYKNLTYAPIVMYSGAFLLFIKQISEKLMKTNISKYVHFIKKYTFPIYLMHYYIIEILNRYLYLTNYTKSIFYRLGMPFIVIPITIIITALIRKLRLGKKVLP